MINTDNLRRSTKAFLLKSLFAAHSKVSGGNHQSILWAYQKFELTPYNIMQKGYFQGVVPLPSVSNNTIVEWHDPEFRGIVPITGFKAQEGLLRLLKKNKKQPVEQQFQIKINSDFRKTIENCAHSRRNTSRTWLSHEYINVAVDLHHMGIAHSIETYQNGEMVGGVIGYAINGYFVDVTLFSTVDNASKVGYYFLLEKLKDAGFKLHDSGFGNNWFSQFGATNMPREEFKMNLTKAIVSSATFNNEVPELSFESGLNRENNVAQANTIPAANAKLTSVMT